MPSTSTQLNGSKAERKLIAKIATAYLKAVVDGYDPYRATDGMTARLVVLKHGRRAGALAVSQVVPESQFGYL